MTYADALQHRFPGLEPQVDDLFLLEAHQIADWIVYQRAPRLYDDGSDFDPGLTAITNVVSPFRPPLRMCCSPARRSGSTWPRNSPRSSGW